MFIDSAQTRPGIPSGPGATSPRDAVHFVAAKSSSCVTRSSSLHTVVSPERENGVHPASSLLLSSRCRGNKVPMTLASNTGSMFAINGGWVRQSQLSLNHPLNSASLLPVVLVVAGDLFFVAYPPAPTPLEPSVGPNASSSDYRDLVCPPVDASVACTAAGHGTRHRGVANRAHIPPQAFRFLVDAALLRCPRIPAPHGYGDRRLEQVSIPFLQSLSWCWRWAGTAWTSGVAADLSGGRSLRGQLHHYV